MLVVKTLVLTDIVPLTNDNTTEFDRSQDLRASVEGFTVEELELPYGASLAGLRFESVQYNVDDSQRDPHYDALVNAYRARSGFYEQMRDSDASNGTTSVRALSIEEVRELAKRKEEQT